MSTTFLSFCAFLFLAYSSLRSLFLPAPLSNFGVASRDLSLLMPRARAFCFFFFFLSQAKISHNLEPDSLLRTQSFLPLIQEHCNFVEIPFFFFFIENFEPTQARGPFLEGPEIYGPFSGAIIPPVSQERRGFR